MESIQSFTGIKLFLTNVLTINIEPCMIGETLLNTNTSYTVLPGTPLKLGPIYGEHFRYMNVVEKGKVHSLTTPTPTGGST